MRAWFSGLRASSYTFFANVNFASLLTSPMSLTFVVWVFDTRHHAALIPAALCGG